MYRGDPPEVRGFSAASSARREQKRSKSKVPLMQSVPLGNEAFGQSADLTTADRSRLEVRRVNRQLPMVVLMLQIEGRRKRLMVSPSNG